MSVLGALAALSPAAWAQDADPAPEAAEQPHITWIDGWEAGRTAARESGALMLVYVHRTSPP